MTKDRTRKQKLAALRSELKQLENPPAHFDQLDRARRCDQAHTLCHKAYDLYERRAGRAEEEEVWKAAARLSHRLLAEAFPANFDDHYDLLKAGNLAGLETAVAFLEIDPWFFRSGYVKADLLKFVARVKLPQPYVLRLQAVILKVIDFRDRREFRHYCRLAKKVQDKEFRNQLEQRLAHADPGVRRRARWVLAAITHNETFHINRGAKQFRLKKYSDALGDFNRALLLAPNSAVALLNRGMALGRLGQFAEAIADFNRVVELNEQSNIRRSEFCKRWPGVNFKPDRSITARSWRGWSYACLFEYQKAIEDFTEVIDADAKHSSGYRGRGRASYNVQRFEQARADLEQSILLEPDSHESHFLLGLTYQAQFRFDLALIELRLFGPASG